MPESCCGTFEGWPWLGEEARVKIGFSGLGQMGKPMAMNLLKSGAEVTVNDIRPEKFPQFERLGAKATSDIGRLVDTDVLFLSLPNSEVVESTLLGDHGLADKLRPGQIVVDTSTISYASTMKIAEGLARRKVGFLDAPVSGMEARAIDGTLTVMCGGEADVFERVRPLLECIGNKILHMGGAGTGQLAKLINQLLFDINCAALAEILPMSVKMGLDPRKAGEVVNSGTGRSYASEFFIPRILANSFSSGYPLKHAYKDLVSAAEIGANLCIPMPVLAAATSTYQMALLKGYGDSDKGAMIRVFEEILGVTYRAPSAETPVGKEA
jgi:3-hydroxyisobutyrate dehydrogenase-like beta-hydroxyacid dehydrogenase